MNPSRMYKTAALITFDTAAVLDQQDVAPTLLPTRQPQQPARMLLNLSGATTGGDVRIFGQVSGSPDDETVTLDKGDADAQGRLNFTSIDRFETPIPDGKLAANAVRATGEPFITEVVGGTVMCRTKGQRGEIRMNKTGREEVGDYLMAAIASELLRPGNYAYIRFVGQYRKKFEIKFVTPPGELGNVNVDLKFLRVSEEGP